MVRRAALHHQDSKHLRVSTWCAKWVTARKPWRRRNPSAGRAWAWLGNHSLDRVQCALGTDHTGPVEIWPQDHGPRCKVAMRHANGILLQLEGAKRGMEDLGAIFVGDKERIEILRGDHTAEPKELRQNAPPPTPQGLKESIPHIENSFACIRTRKPADANAEIGLRTTTLCHLVNISRAVQRTKLRWDPKEEKFLSDKGTNQLLARPRRKGYELPKI